MAANRIRSLGTDSIFTPPVAIVVYVKALVKSRREPGLWLEDVDVPTIGINDVLIQVLRTGICGTDVHIYKWDEWAQKTIPVPMAIGHEFVGRIVEVGLERRRLLSRATLSAAKATWSAGAAATVSPAAAICARTRMGVGVNRPGAFAEFIALPMTNIWRHHEGDAARCGRDLRPVRQRRAHRALLPGAGRGCADHRRRPIGIMAAAVARARRRALHRDHGPESVPAGTGAQDGRDARRERARDEAARTCRRNSA